MNKLSISILTITIYAFVSCHSTNPTGQNNDTTSTTPFIDEHSSQNSLDWAGVYQDTIPCADCPGIFTTVKLYEDGTYAYSVEYIDRNTTVQDSGKFMWHNNGSIVHLQGEQLNIKFKVGENILIPTDEQGTVIESNLIDQMTLHKIMN